MPTLVPSSYLVHTLAFGGVALLCGHALRRVLPLLERYSFPAPVIGGLLVAIVVLVARDRGIELLHFDTTLQSPLMIAFFTTIGFGASLSLLRVGGPQMLRFFLLASAFAVVQNVVGILLAWSFGLHRSVIRQHRRGFAPLTGSPGRRVAYLAGMAGIPHLRLTRPVIGHLLIFFALAATIVALAMLQIIGHEMMLVLLSSLLGVYAAFGTLIFAFRLTDKLPSHRRGPPVARDERPRSDQ